MKIVNQAFTNETIFAQDLSMSVFWDLKFSKVNFSGSYFTDCKFENCTVKNCNLINSSFSKVEFDNNLFIDCQFYKVGLVWSYWLDCILKK